MLKFGSNGEGNGQFNAPTGVAVDSNGNIIVADWGNSRIQVEISVFQRCLIKKANGLLTLAFRLPIGLEVIQFLTPSFICLTLHLQTWWCQIVRFSVWLLAALMATVTIKDFGAK